MPGNDRFPRIPSGFLTFEGWSRRILSYFSDSVILMSTRSFACCHVMRMNTYGVNAFHDIGPVPFSSVERRALVPSGSDVIQQRSTIR